MRFWNMWHRFNFLNIKYSYICFPTIKFIYLTIIAILDKRDELISNDKIRKLLIYQSKLTSELLKPSHVCSDTCFYIAKNFIYNQNARLISAFFNFISHKKGVFMIQSRHFLYALSTLALAISTSTAFAISFNGFYVGAAGGGSFARGTQDSEGSTTKDLSIASLDGSTVLPLASTRGSLDFDADVTKNSGIGELFAGYGRSWNMFYLSGEVFVSGSNYQMDNSIDTSFNQSIFLGLLSNKNSGEFDTSARMSSFQYGVTFRPGILLTPNSLLFFRIGTTIAKEKYSVNSSQNSIFAINPSGLDQAIGGGPMGDVPTTGDSGGLISGDQSAAAGSTLAIVNNVDVSKNRTRASLQLGAGLEQYFATNWSVRMDYVYTYYGKVNVSGANAATQTLPVFGLLAVARESIAEESSVKLSDNAVTLGIVYHFDCV